ncbi:MAG: glycosyltransferase family 4 protein [Chloroflexota bacterium]
MSSSNKPIGVLIFVENLPVPNNRRVWLEATTLTKANYEVSIISITGKGAKQYYECLEGIHIYRYPAPPLTESTLSFIFEFAYCWVMSFLLSFVVAFRHGFKIIHACNPPETFWLIGLFYKLFGKKFIFDHHDLSPEMYYSRFRRKGIAYKGLLFLEKMTFRSADLIITTNQTQEKVAIERGNYPQDKIYIVRNGPDKEILKPNEPDLSLKQGHQYMVGYLGVINPQDGVDSLILVADYIVKEKKRDDILFLIMGTGDAIADLHKMVEDLELTAHVHFTGWVEQETIASYLSVTDIGVDTMPKNPYSDAATTNKILEYMSVECPIVCFDLVESRVSGGDAAIYAEPDNIVDLADKILALLADKAKREQMGQLGRQRIETELSWQHQSENLLAAYRDVLNQQ